MSKLSSIVSETAKAPATRARRRSEGRWVPNTDAYLGESGLVIKVELAGLRRENLELTVDGHALRIAGRRDDGCRTGNCSFLAMEINYGAFETVIEVPDGFDLTRAKASYLNGFLRVDIPVAESAAPAGGARAVAVKRG
jgi:HSP20 family protein